MTAGMDLLADRIACRAASSGTLSRPGEATYNAATYTNDRTSTDVYSGWMMVRSGGQPSDTSGPRSATSVTTGLRVSMPLSVVPQPDDVIVLDVCDDPALVGVSLYVVGVVAGERTPVRQVIVERHQSEVTA